MSHGTWGRDPRTGNPNQLVDPPDLDRMHDLMAAGLTQRDASLVVWSPADARPLTHVEEIRLSFIERFRWLRGVA